MFVAFYCTAAETLAGSPRNLNLSVTELLWLQQQQLEQLKCVLCSHSYSLTHNFPSIAVDVTALWEPQQ